MCGSNFVWVNLFCRFEVQGLSGGREQNRALVRTEQRAWRGAVDLSRKMFYHLQTSRIIPGLTLFEDNSFTRFPGGVLVQEHWLPIVHLRKSKIYQSLSLDRCQSAIITLWHWRFIERSYSLILSRSGPLLFSCLLCCCQGYFIFCYTFVLLGRRFSSNIKWKGKHPQWLLWSRQAFQSSGILGGRFFLIIFGRINARWQSPSVWTFSCLHDCPCLANCVAANESEQAQNQDKEEGKEPAEHFYSSFFSFKTKKWSVEFSRASWRKTLIGTTVDMCQENSANIAGLFSPMIFKLWSAKRDMGKKTTAFSSQLIWIIRCVWFTVWFMKACK